ncbi:MAG: FAD-dependent oxidoreductase [Verrucomicrobiota bacterium]
MAPLIQAAEDFDVLVYGATPAGIAAALAAGRDGERVLLVEPGSWIGGVVTNGLSHADFRTFESLTGTYGEFAKRVLAHYRSQYGADSEQVKDSSRGTNAEPKVNLAVYEKMLAEVPSIQVKTEWALDELKCSFEGERDLAKQVRAVEIALFYDTKGRRTPVSAKVFIDATYEGDLMAAAGAAYRVGREGRAEFGESAAPDVPDNELQAYNFRMTMTADPSNRSFPRAPKGYVAEDFYPVIPLLMTGKITGVFGTNKTEIFKAQIPRLPNGKFDVNDMSNGVLRLSMPGENLEWPDGVAGKSVREGSHSDTGVAPYHRLGVTLPRQRALQAHKLWNVGLLYFLQNDISVPERFRKEAREWGFPKDEFLENGHFPEQLYVREARRMEGRFVFTQNETMNAKDDARAVWLSDSVAIGDYGPNCHGTGHEGSRFGGKHSGEIYLPCAPYQIPYGVLVPNNVENLLVPGALSASHVGFCALRYEPVWMSLGEAAGHAAHLANSARTSVQRVKVPVLQSRLHETGSATVYFSDVAPGDTDFALVQWWGSLGGFHGIEASRATPGERGNHIVGQYFEAFPGHAADLSRVLDERLAQRWATIATTLGIDPTVIPVRDGNLTRGEWLRKVRRCVKS